MQRLNKLLNNQRGLTLIELAVGSVVGLIVLGLLVTIFTGERDKLENEFDNTRIRSKGRHAIKVLTEEIRMAGYGMPPSEGITDIDTANSISYRSNLDNVRTTTPPAPGGTTVASSGATALPVVDGTDFTSGDNIVIYDPAFKKMETNTVSSAASTSLAVSALANDYIYPVNAALITVNKYNEVTIYQSGNQVVKIVDGGSAEPIIGDLASTDGLVFDFYGATATTAVRKIGITLNMVDPDNSDATLTFQTDVMLRNSAFN